MESNVVVTGFANSKCVRGRQRGKSLFTIHNSKKHRSHE